MKTIPHGNNRYNWPGWADGQWRKYRFGRHFTCKPNSFRQQVLAAAKAMDTRAETRLLEGGVVAAVIYPKVIASQNQKTCGRGAKCDSVN